MILSPGQSWLHFLEGIHYNNKVFLSRTKVYFCASNNRLTCNKMVRVKKLVDYIKERVSVEPDETLELVLGDKVLHSTWTVATVKYLYHNKKTPMVVHYQLKHLST